MDGLSAVTKAPRPASTDDVYDIIQEQDEMLSHRQEFYLHPRRWEAFPPHKLSWTLVRLSPTTDRKTIPQAAGVYTLVISPGIAGHPACSYLMYVGQADSLRRRFGEYLTKERRPTGRPHIFRILHKYSDYLWFCFAPVQQTQLSEVEDDLIKAYSRPPGNRDVPAEVRAVMNAF